MSDLRLEDVYPTGEYRAPEPGDLYIPQSTEKVQESIFGHPSRDRRIIVKERPQRIVYVDNALRAAMDHAARQGGGEVHLLSNQEDLEQIERDEKKEIAADAREAALLMLTKLVLDDGTGWEARVSVARTILELT